MLGLPLAYGAYDLAYAAYLWLMPLTLGLRLACCAYLWLMTWLMNHKHRSIRTSPNYAGLWLLIELMLGLLLAYLWLTLSLCLAYGYFPPQIFHKLHKLSSETGPLEAKLI